MMHLIFLAAEAASTLLPFAALFFLQRGQKTVSFFWRALLFALYISAVLHITNAGTLYQLLRYGIEFRQDTINLVPFSRVSTPMDYRGCLLNVLMTVPLGLLIPLIWPEKRKFWTALSTGFVFSLVIELSQLMNNRRTDVDDLICNTVGACLGFLLSGLWARPAKGKNPEGPPKPYGPAAYMAVIFLGRFLLFDDFGLAKRLYGF